MSVEEREPPATAGAAAGEADERVAAVLERLRAGVRQRQAELASAGAGGDEGRLAVAVLRRSEFVEEPVLPRPASLPRRALHLARRAVFHLFLKWYTRPLLAQQNELNAAVARLLEELVVGRQSDAVRLARRVEELERRLAALEGGRR
jgi:hypothetical protein